MSMEVVVDENVLPVVVVGAGPIGLAAAAQLLDRGLEPLVLEAGPAAGASVRQWHHVRLFSRWGELVDPAAEKLLARTGWRSADPDTYPTGAEWAQHYLRPLADALGQRTRFGARVIGVARRGRDRVVDECAQLATLIGAGWLAAILYIDAVISPAGTVSR